MTTRLLGVIALSTAVLGCGTAEVGSQTPNACAPFEVMGGSERSVEYIDFGNDGPGAGDMVIGRRNLVDAAGNDMGSNRWVIIVLEAPPPSGGPRENYGTHVLNLDDGQIHYQFLTEAVRPREDTAQVSVSDYTGVIVGGTGAYSDARGTVDRSFDGGLMGTFAVNIHCD